MRISTSGTRTAGWCVVAASVVLLFLPAMTQAGPVLYDWSVSVNGTTYNPPVLPSSVNSSGFDFSTGLGSMTLAFNEGSGQYGGIYLNIYFDNGFGDVTDAYGTVVGAAAAGVSYQLDDPNLGVLWTNFSGNTLDGSNAVAAYLPPPTACCEVGMALIHAFDVAPGNVGSLTFTVSLNVPSSGFYLQETDHDWGDNVYLTESFTQGPAGAVPEPGTWLLVASGAGLALLRRVTARQGKG